MNRRKLTFGVARNYELIQNGWVCQTCRRFSVNQRVVHKKIYTCRRAVYAGYRIVKIIPKEKMKHILRLLDKELL